MNKKDILIIIYPNLINMEKLIILNPFDNKIMTFDVRTVNELKEILKNGLPFCSQFHEPRIHLGGAYIINWGDIPETKLSIKFPEDIDKVLG